MRAIYIFFIKNTTFGTTLTALRINVQQIFNLRNSMEIRVFLRKNRTALAGCPVKSLCEKTK